MELNLTASSCVVLDFDRLEEPFKEVRENYGRHGERLPQSSVVMIDLNESQCSRSRPGNYNHSPQSLVVVMNFDESQSSNRNSQDSLLVILDFNNLEASMSDVEKTFFSTSTPVKAPFDASVEATITPLAPGEDMQFTCKFCDTRM